MLYRGIMRRIHLGRTKYDINEGFKVKCTAHHRLHACVLRVDRVLLFDIGMTRDMCK